LISCLGAFAKLRKAIVSFVTTRLPLDGFSLNFMFRKYVVKIQVTLKSAKNNGTVHEAQYTILIISRSFLLRMNDVSVKSCRETRNTHFVFNNFLSNVVSFYGIMWKNVVELGRPQMARWRMRIACCIPKATNAHSQYVIPIAFPLRQWLQESASVFRYFLSYVY